MIADQAYHIFNRGNNRGTIFFQKRNFDFFLNKIQTHIIPHADVLAYCLMPTHFHLLVWTKPSFNYAKFPHDLRLMLSSYTRAINKQEGRTGSLFQQHTKIKLIDNSNYAATCFHYIHQNPMKAKLVSKMENWEYSSFQEYLLDKEGLANKDVAFTYLDLPNVKGAFEKLSYDVIIYKTLNIDR